jgi:hypothetical protein
MPGGTRNLDQEFPDRRSRPPLGGGGPGQASMSITPRRPKAAGLLPFYFIQTYRSHSHNKVQPLTTTSGILPDVGRPANRPSCQPIRAPGPRDRSEEPQLRRRVRRLRAGEYTPAPFLIRASQRRRHTGIYDERNALVRLLAPRCASRQS